jgi:vacuolar-type H+-ATPase subunit E/Vma4
MESTKNTDLIEILRQEILQEAKMEADRILKEARETVAGIKEDAGEKKVFVEDVQIKKISNTLDEELHDNASFLEKERSRRILQFKQDSLDRVIIDALKQFKEKMVENPDYYYNTYLNELIRSSLENTTFKECYLMVNARDKEFIQENPDFLNNFNKKITLKDETFNDDDLGCIIQDKKSNIEFDNRLSKKIEGRIDFIKTRISLVLFQQG